MSTDSTETGSTLDSVKKKSLKAAGIAYLVGDAAMFGAGVLEKDLGGAAGGLIWGLGSLTAARYGNPTAEKQLELLNHKLHAYLKKQGIEIPVNPTTAHLTKEGGVIEHIEKFLYANPSQILNAIYAIGGVTTARGGFHKDMKADMAKGMFVTAGGLAGLLIPEKKPNLNHAPQGVLEKTWSWIQEKPLRISGLLYHANNAVSIYGIHEKWGQQVGKPKTNLYLRAITAASFIFANTMLAMSSKGHAENNKTDVTDELANISATVIAAQPKEVREALIQQISGYLASQPEIDKKPDEIASILHAKLTEIAEPKPEKSAHWQNKINTSPMTESPAI